MSSCSLAVIDYLDCCLNLGDWSWHNAMTMVGHENRQQYGYQCFHSHHLNSFDHITLNHTNCQFYPITCFLITTFDASMVCRFAMISGAIPRCLLLKSTVFCQLSGTMAAWRKLISWRFLVGDIIVYWGIVRSRFDYWRPFHVYFINSNLTNVVGLLYHPSSHYLYTIHHL